MLYTGYRDLLDVVVALTAKKWALHHKEVDLITFINKKDIEDALAELEALNIINPIASKTFNLLSYVQLLKEGILQTAYVNDFYDFSVKYSLGVRGKDDDSSPGIQYTAKLYDGLFNDITVFFRSAVDTGVVFCVDEKNYGKWIVKE